MQNQGLLVIALVVVVCLSIQFAPQPADGALFGGPKYETRRNITEGKRKFGDRLLFMDIVKIERRFYVYTVVEDVAFPLPGEKNNATISYIEAIDKMPLRESGNARILRGGVGTKNVTIRVQSRAWCDLHYKVQIYGQ